MDILLLQFDPDTLSDAMIARIKALTPDMQVVLTRDRDEIDGMLDDIKIVAGWGPYDAFLKGRSLRWLQQWGAGADWIAQYPEFVASNVILTNVSGVHAIPISEHILGLMLTFARGLHYAARAARCREWTDPPREGVFELAGKTMVLIGIGAIGQRTAEIAAALGMRVLGVRRNQGLSAPGLEAVFSADRLLDILPEADFLVVTAPLTDETRGMIGERQLRGMQRTSYIINTGRGGTIQEDALIRALQEGWIAGAGLDVFETEPLAEDSPLWEMENVIVTAHYAGRTPHYNERALDIFIDNLQRYRANKPLRNVVNKTLGY